MNKKGSFEKNENQVAKKNIMMFYSRNIDTIERLSEHFLDLYKTQLAENKTRKVHFELKLYDDLDSVINLNVVNLDKFSNSRQLQSCHSYRAKFKKRVHVSNTNFGRWKQPIANKIKKVWSVAEYAYIIREFT